jgi:hypothetical protein
MSGRPPPLILLNHMAVRRRRYMSSDAEAATSGRCTLTATVLPPHLAASSFPMAASSCGPRRSLALYTCPMDADAIALLSFENSNRLSIGSFATSFSSLFLASPLRFLKPSFHEFRVTFIRGCKSESSRFMIFIASSSSNAPTASTSFPSSSAHILFRIMSGLRLNAWPDCRCHKGSVMRSIA